MKTNNQTLTERVSKDDDEYLNVKSTCYSKPHLTAYLARLRAAAGFYNGLRCRGRVTRTTQFLSRLPPSDQSASSWGVGVYTNTQH